MAKFKTSKKKMVLIALDYYPTAQKVAEEGFSLAKTMDAEIVLMHVIADSTYYLTLEYSRVSGFMGFSDADASHLFDDSLKKAMKYFLDKYKQHLGDTTIKVLVKEGEFAETILKTASDLNADIIVMGSHSRRWLEKIVMGSVTEKVLNQTSIPLFIIPTKKHN
jgi:nucleotide-binding universal stress UspA family protein